jgi:hypothetical protein
LDEAQAGLDGYVQLRLWKRRELSDVGLLHRLGDAAHKIVFSRASLTSASFPFCSRRNRRLIGMACGAHGAVGMPDCIAEAAGSDAFSWQER